MALAADDDLEAHRRLVAESRVAQRRARPADEYQACRSAVERLPSGPGAPACRRRLAYLEARRDADGSLTTWTRFVSARRGFHQDPESVRDRIEALPREGVVGAELALWLARDALGQGQPARALSFTEPWAQRPLPSILRQDLLGAHALALAGVGRDDEALAVQRQVQVVADGVRLTPVEEALLHRRRQHLAMGAWAVVLGFIGVSVPSLARRRSLPGLPVGLGLLAGIAIATWLLAEGWAEGAGLAIPYWLGGVGLVHLVASWSLPQASGVMLHALRGAAALASLGVFYLALHATQSLAWVGL